VNDLAYSRRQHEIELNMALFELGSQHQHIEYWNCTDKNRQTVKAAKEYLALRSGKASEPLGPEITEAMAPATENALQFCQQK